MPIFALFICMSSFRTLSIIIQCEGRLCCNIYFGTLLVNLQQTSKTTHIFRGLWVHRNECGTPLLPNNVGATKKLHLPQKLLAHYAFMQRLLCILGVMCYVLHYVMFCVLCGRIRVWRRLVKVTFLLVATRTFNFFVTVSFLCLHSMVQSKSGSERERWNKRKDRKANGCRELRSCKN